MTGSLTCSRCGEEVRWGSRNGQLAYLHRKDKDHLPLFGRLLQPGEWEAIAGAHHALGGHDKDGNVDEGHAVEEIEVRATPLPLATSPKTPVLEADGSPSLTPKGSQRMQELVEVAGRQVLMPGSARSLANLVQRTPGWEVRRFTYARGPYLAASGKSLGISDSIVLTFAAPMVDADRLYGVASWRDGKPDIAWRINANRTVDQLGAQALTKWIKEYPDGTDTR